MTDARPAASTARDPSAGLIAPGTVVGGRFEIEVEIRADSLGKVFRAKDQKTQKPISLRVLRLDVLGEPGVKTLKEGCRAAAKLSHRNIAATYGVGTKGAPFVASEWVEGQPLAELIAKRRAAGGQMSLRGAYNVIAHVCNALSAVHPTGCHGALRPEVVWVTKNGRVKVADFGVGQALLLAGGPNVLPVAEQASLAPEVKAGGPPTAASDIFGVGAILYQLLTGKSPADGFVPPSQAHPDASPALDQVLLTCLAPDPSGRFQSPDEVRAALQPLVADAPETAAEDFDLDVDIDIDMASQRPPATAAAAAVPAPPKPPRPPAAPGAPQVGARVSIHEEFRPSLPGAPGMVGGPAPQAPAPAAEVDLGGLLAKITENDAARWMVVKDGLDHGPFSGRELVELIVKSDVLEEHSLMNMDTGERKLLRQWPEFREFIDQAKIGRDEKARAAAIASAEAGEKRSGVFKIAVAAALLLAVGTGVTIFLVTRESGETENVAAANLGDLFARGEIELTGTAGILPDPPRSGRRHGMGGGMRAAVMAGQFVGSYEDAMNVPIELGDVTSMGGQGRLDPGSVQGVMNRNLNRIFNSCVVPESRRGGSLGNVTIDIAIAGSGRVMGVSARQGSGQFKSCIRGAVRNIRFPTFGSARMGARYGFSAN